MNPAVKNLYKQFGALSLFKNMSLDFPEFKITAILGPSGCGKTTLLNILSGSDNDYRGAVVLPDDFSFGYLFQEPRLIPWKTVRGNLEFVLSHTHEKEQMEDLIADHLESVGLTRFSDYYPHELSGGMKQRVSMARAFTYTASAILMDEPFQGLDVNLKLLLTEAFLNLWEREERTVIYVTHDIQEAVLLGDYILVLSEPPAAVRHEMYIDIPQKKRTLEDPEIGRYVRELYALMAYHEKGNMEK